MMSTFQSEGIRTRLHLFSQAGTSDGFPVHPFNHNNGSNTNEETVNEKVNQSRNGFSADHRVCRR